MNASTQHTADFQSMWRNPFGIALMVYYLVMALIGMLVPDDILKSYAWAREFSDFMASIIPQIDRVTSLNIKPDVNRFYFAVLWAGSPVSLCLCVASTWQIQLNAKKKMWDMPVHKVILLCLAYLLIIFGAQFGYWMTDTTNRQLLLFLEDALGRGLWGSIVYVHGTALFGGIFILMTFGWFTTYINPEIKRNSNV